MSRVACRIRDLGAYALLFFFVSGAVPGPAETNRATPSGALPTTPEGRPDFTGVWIASSRSKPTAPALLPAAAAAAPNRKLHNSDLEPPCLPGSPLIDTGIYKFVQTPALLLIVFKDLIGYRQVFLDGRLHPKDADPSWMGHSIGRWVGDTLTVDTVALNDRGRLRLYRHGEKLHMTERYRRRDWNRFEVRTSIDDPETFARPWKIDNELSLAPDQDVLEYVCNENVSRK